MSNNALPNFDLQKLMDEYGLGVVKDVSKAKGGKVNEIWTVRVEEETVVVRGVTKGRPRSDIQFEHSFIRALGRKGLSYRLPRPLRTRTGRSVVLRNGSYVWVYKYIEGSKARPSRDEVIAQIAHAMATVHKAAQSISLRYVKRPF